MYNQKKKSLNIYSEARWSTWSASIWLCVCVYDMHFPASLSNYNGTTAYVCRRFIPTTAFLVVFAFTFKSVRLYLKKLQNSCFKADVWPDKCADKSYILIFYISLVMVKNYQQCTNVTDMQTHTHTRTNATPYCAMHAGRAVKMKWCNLPWSVRWLNRNCWRRCQVGLLLVSLNKQAATALNNSLHT